GSLALASLVLDGVGGETYQVEANQTQTWGVPAGRGRDTTTWKRTGEDTYTLHAAGSDGSDGTFALSSCVLDGHGAETLTFTGRATVTAGGRETVASTPRPETAIDSFHYREALPGADASGRQGADVAGSGASGSGGGLEYLYDVEGASRGGGAVGSSSGDA